MVAIVLHLVSVNQWVNHTTRVIARSYRCLQLAVDAETGMRGFVITGRNSFLEPYTRTKDLLNDEIVALSDLVQDNPAQVARLKVLRERLLVWMEFAESVVQDKNSGGVRKDLVATEQGKKLMDATRVGFNEFIRTEEALRDRRTADTDETIRLALLLVIIGSLLYGAVLAVFSRRQMNTLSSTYDNALQKQFQQNEFLQKQDWIKTAQAQFAEATRGDLSIQAVCDRTLEFICSYLGVRVGAMYTLESDQILHLASHYGLSESDRISKTAVPVGTSLAGQAAREKQPIVLEPAPANHVQMNTFLGSSSPLSIILTPALAEQRTKAVIELALLRSTTPDDIELLKTLSESIGVTIASAQYRSQLRDLLEESQRQGEELQAQQEELRVSNEELEEQARALKESQVKLEGQQAELEQTNSQLSQQAQALEERNNDLDNARNNIEQKAQEVERASQYKSQFLANMSHELRTPLNSTLILAQLLSDNRGGRLDQEEMEYARTILNSSNDLLNLINDILDLAKIESGKVELSSDAVNVTELVRSLERTFKPIAQQKSIEFKTEIAADVNPKMLIDR
ncbi:MAG: GAF domain-containing protein, partial [Proteobacteria bacterium]